MKLTESTQGRVTMANGTMRTAYQNTYKTFGYGPDGAPVTGTETRIEFATDTAAGRSRVWRKASEKQAATFTV